MNIPIYGEVDEGALTQIKTCAEEAEAAALMADHHLGYSMPIGGVVAYKGAVSPSGVGYDIACGNKAVKLDVDPDKVKRNISAIMDRVYSAIEFGVGRSNDNRPEHELFDDDPAWSIPEIGKLKELARNQLGTVGSGNHFVDIFESENDGAIWIGVHFGSRGLGHKITTHYLKEAGGTDNMFAPPTLLEDDSDLGEQYIAGMKLAGRYAYAGRDWVCAKVATIIGGDIVQEVHNHHNFAWKENHNGEDVWVVRKGATPAFPNQYGFIGGSMGDHSYIIKGKESDESKRIMYSTIHGAGRVMSRRQAAGKTKWINGKRTRVADGEVSRAMMKDWIGKWGVELRGAGCDESPHCYKRIDDVIGFHAGTITIEDKLKPLGVAMAGDDEFDPYKD